MYTCLDVVYARVSSWSVRGKWLNLHFENPKNLKGHSVNN